MAPCSYLGEKHEHFSLTSVAPEFTQDGAWNDFFVPLTGDVAARAASESFMRGSLGYHFHGAPDGGVHDKGRYFRGIPEGSWAGVLRLRYEGIARAKVGVCAAAAEAGVKPP